MRLAHHYRNLASEKVHEAKKAASTASRLSSSHDRSAHASPKMLDDDDDDDDDEQHGSADTAVPLLTLLARARR